jgi:multidrug transporter EmrE-like cation transporter
MVWAVAILAIETRISGYRTAFREKLIQKSSQATTSMTGSGYVIHELPGTAELNRLQENLREITEGLKAENHSNNALPIAAKEIQLQVADLLRPLSHRIWFNAEKNRPQFHLAGLLSQALRTLNINVLLTVTVGSGIFLLGALSLVSLQESLLRTIGYTLSLGLSLLVLKKATHKRPKRTAVGVAVLLAIATVTILGSELLASFVLYGEPATSYPLVAIAGPLSTLALLTLAAVLGQLDEDWRLIDSMLDSSDIGLKDTATDIRFASFLHNTLQSELNGIALNLSEQVDRDSPEVRTLLARLEKISTEPIADRYIASQLRDHEYLLEMVEAWDPLIRIKLDISPAVASHPRLPLLIELAEESISNAVRHSATKEISLSASVVDQDIVAVISQPAKISTPESKKLGAGWLAGYTKSHRTTWEDGKRKLVVVL